MANSDQRPGSAAQADDGKRFHFYLIVLLIAAAVYAGCMVSPPSLMDDVDAVQAQIARNMLASGDWVTARLDGSPVSRKSPADLLADCAISFKIFGAYDWAARIPVVLAAIALAWLTTAFGTWAFGRAPASMPVCAYPPASDFFLFTRILIPDVMLTAQHRRFQCGHSCARSMRKRRGRAGGLCCWPPAWASACC